ncbi:MAG: hypothetical protein MR902_07410 [Campylobacter sp.]|nr:hypothetical protein [Campylobacter sp.]
MSWQMIAHSRRGRYSKVVFSSSSSMLEIPGVFIKTNSSKTNSSSNSHPPAAILA